MVRPLTDKQQRFVDEYLVSLNATQAAIKAGYSVKNAESLGYQLLQKTPVSEAIQAKMAARSARTEITADRVIKELALLGFSDMGKFATWGGDDVVLMDSSEVDTRCVLEVKETPMKTGGKALGIKLHDKVGALKLIGQHLNIFVERHEHSGPGGGPIPTQDLSRLSTADLESLIGILSRAERTRDSNDSTGSGGAGETYPAVDAAAGTADSSSRNASG